MMRSKCRTSSVAEEGKYTAVDYKNTPSKAIGTGGGAIQ